MRADIQVASVPVCRSLYQRVREVWIGLDELLAD